MAQRHPDPFEDLRLDERFVRDARFLEPSASERSGQASRGRGVRCKVVPAPRGLQGFVHRLFLTPHPSPRSRRITRVVAVLTLAVSMVSLTFVALRQSAGRGTLAAGQSAPATGGSASRSGLLVAASTGDGPAVPTTGATAASTRLTPAATDPTLGVPNGFVLAPSLLRVLRKGDCLAWTPSSTRPVTLIRVDCASPHLDEVTKIVDLSGRFSRWPGAQALAAAATQACQGSLREYVGALSDAPHHVVGSVRPDEASWAQGSHGVACTIRSDDLVARKGRFTVDGAAVHS